MATIEELMRDAFERDRLSRPSPQAQAWQASRGTTMGGGPNPTGNIFGQQAARNAAPQAAPPNAPPNAASQPGPVARAAGNKWGPSVGRVGAGVAGGWQLGMGLNQLTGDGGMADKAGGAVRTGVGALSTLEGMAPTLTRRFLPNAGPWGAAAAIGLTAGDVLAEPSLRWIRSNPKALNVLNSVRGAIGSAPLEPLPAGEQVWNAGGFPDPAMQNPILRAAAEKFAPKADGKGAAAVPAAAPVAVQAAAPANPPADQKNDATTPPAAPAADAPAKGRGSAKRAAQVSQFARDRVAQLQQMAVPSQEIARPPVAQVATDQQAGSGGIQVLGPADGYQGMNQVAPGVYEAPVWNGPSPVQGVPEGQVMIDRGGGQNIIQSFANTQKGGTERAAFMPELAGLSPGQLAEFINNSAGSSDPRIMSANKQAIDLMKQSMAETGATERTGMNVEGGIEQAREHTRSAGNVASISAQAQMDVANRPKYFPGQRTTNIDGSTAYTEPAIFNPADGSVMAPQRKKEARTQPQIDSLVTQYRSKYKVDEKTARQAVMSIFDLKK